LIILPTYGAADTEYISTIVCRFLKLGLLYEMLTASRMRPNMKHLTPLFILALIVSHARGADTFDASTGQAT